MALFQLPALSVGTVHVLHSGEYAGAAFTTTLDAVATHPSTPQANYLFDLNIFAPDLVAMAPAAPLVGVFQELTGKQVQVDVEIADQQIIIRFSEPVVPLQYRIKVVG